MPAIPISNFLVGGGATGLYALGYNRRPGPTPGQEVRIAKAHQGCSHLQVKI